MSPYEREPRLRLPKLSENIHLYNDTAQMKEARGRLRAGEPYQPGDVIAWFDELGNSRYVRVDKIDKELDFVEVTASHPVYRAAVIDSLDPNAQPDHEYIDSKQLDKFCRGVRADLAILLNEVNWEIGQLTEVFPMKEILEAQRTGDWSKVPKLKSELLREGLKQGIRDFYYHETPNYQQLLDALSDIVSFVNTRVAERTGIEFSNIRNMDDVMALLKQLFGIQPVESISSFNDIGTAFSKYTNRLNACGRAAFALCLIWLEEHPDSWEDHNRPN